MDRRGRWDLFQSFQVASQPRRQLGRIRELLALANASVQIGTVTDAKSGHHRLAHGHLQRKPAWAVKPCAQL